MISTSSASFDGHIHLRSGIITLTEQNGGWSGKVTKVPRHAITGFLSENPVPAGAYLLVGRSSTSDVPAFYIGETSDPQGRKSAHLKSKDFWEDCILVTRQFPRAHDITEIKYIEAHLLEIVDRSRVEKHNRKLQKRPAVESVRARALDDFVAVLVQCCLPIIGINALLEGLDPDGPSRATCPAKPKSWTPSDSVEARHAAPKNGRSSGQDAPAEHDVALTSGPVRATHRLALRGIEAFGVFDVATQTMTVLAGSQIASTETPSLLESSRKQRAMWVKKGLLVAGGEPGAPKRLLRDVPGLSPSGASQAASGKSSSGWRDWKSIQNVKETLDALRTGSKRKSRRST